MGQSRYGPIPVDRFYRMARTPEGPSGQQRVLSVAFGQGANGPARQGGAASPTRRLGSTPRLPGGASGEICGRNTISMRVLFFRLRRTGRGASVPPGRWDVPQAPPAGRGNSTRFCPEIRYQCACCFTVCAVLDGALRSHPAGGTYRRPRLPGGATARDFWSHLAGRRRPRETAESIFDRESAGANHFAVSAAAPFNRPPRATSVGR